MFSLFAYLCDYSYVCLLVCLFERLSACVFVCRGVFGCVFGCFVVYVGGCRRDCVNEASRAHQMGVARVCRQVL